MRSRLFNHLRLMVFIVSIVFIRFAGPADAATVNFTGLFSGGSITSLDGSLSFDQFGGDNAFFQTITQINGGLRFNQNSPIGLSDIGTGTGNFSYRVTVLTPPQTLQGFQETATVFQDFGSDSFSFKSELLEPISLASIGVFSESRTLPSQNGVPISGSFVLTGSRVQVVHSLTVTSTITPDSFGAASGSVLLDTYTLTPVPLPPAVILFGAGLLALVGLGAGNWRQRKSTFA